mmetsp:Transcript_19843/g.45743  ORF Transcript_19843/g.45743 Transcript_19843/m.45743 type:complete len:231 (-) Transcript_19843:302-994(-)
MHCFFLLTSFSSLLHFFPGFFLATTHLSTSHLALAFFSEAPARRGRLDGIFEERHSKEDERNAEEHASNDQRRGLLALRINLDQLLANGLLHPLAVAIEHAVHPRTRARHRVVQVRVDAALRALGLEGAHFLIARDHLEIVRASRSPLHKEALVASLVASRPAELDLFFGEDLRSQPATAELSSLWVEVHHVDARRQCRLPRLALLALFLGARDSLGVDLHPRRKLNARL